MTSSFHGRTIGALSVGVIKIINLILAPSLESKVFEFNNSRHLKKLINKRTVAIIIEFIQGDGGINIFQKILQKLSKRYVKKNLINSRQIQGMEELGKICL